MISKSAGLQYPGERLHPGQVKDIDGWAANPALGLTHSRLRFEFTPVHALKADSEIVFTVSHEMFLLPTSCVFNVSGRVQPQATCNGNSIRKTITVTNPFDKNGFEGGA